MKLFIDAETIPSQRPDVMARIEAGIKEPKITKTGKCQSEDDLKAWRENVRPGFVEPEYRKTSLNSALGEIISIAWAINDGEVKSVYRDLGQSEGILLDGFFRQLVEEQGKRRISTWIGHNITGFDMRFLWHRCIINSLQPSVAIPMKAKPWDDAVFDTMFEWSGAKDRISQDDLCFALGIEGKPSDISGANVWDHVKAGDIKRVTEYNIDDVEKVRMIYNRMNFIKSAGA